MKTRIKTLTAAILSVAMLTSFAASVSASSYVVTSDTHENGVSTYDKVINLVNEAKTNLTNAASDDIESNEQLAEYNDILESWDSMKSFYFEFDNLPENHWAHETINRIIWDGWLVSSQNTNNKTADGKALFGTEDGYTTHAEFVGMLYEIMVGDCTEYDYGKGETVCRSYNGKMPVLRVSDANLGVDNYTISPASFLEYNKNKGYISDIEYSGYTSNIRRLTSISNNAVTSYDPDTVGRAYAKLIEETILIPSEDSEFINDPNGITTKAEAAKLISRAISLVDWNNSDWKQEINDMLDELGIEYIFDDIDNLCAGDLARYMSYALCAEDEIKQYRASIEDDDAFEEVLDKYLKYEIELTKEDYDDCDELKCRWDGDKLRSVSPLTDKSVDEVETEMKTKKFKELMKDEVGTSNLMSDKVKDWFANEVVINMCWNGNYNGNYGYHVDTSYTPSTATETSADITTDEFIENFYEFINKSYTNIDYDAAKIRSTITDWSEVNKEDQVYVANCIANGIINGNDKGEMNANDPLKITEAVIMLSKGANITNARNITQHTGAW